MRTRQAFAVLSDWVHDLIQCVGQARSEGVKAATREKPAMRVRGTDRRVYTQNGHSCKNIFGAHE